MDRTIVENSRVASGEILKKHGNEENFQDYVITWMLKQLYKGYFPILMT
jgi:hypothetical protein